MSDNVFNLDYETIKIPKSMIPNGSKLVEAYETEAAIIVIGDPPEDDDEEMGHNCDAMGCGTLSHVMYRFDKTATARIRELEAALAAAKAENERLREKLGVLAEKDWYGIEGDRVEGFPNDGETPLFFNPADDTWCYPWDFATRALEAK